MRGCRLYHQGGSGCRSHGSCLDGIEPDGCLTSVGMVVGDQPFVILYFTSLVLVWKPYSPPGGAEFRTHGSYSVQLSQLHVLYVVCTGLSLCRVKPGPVDSDLIFVES